MKNPDNRDEDCARIRSGERWFIIGMGLAVTIFPLLFGELFPFSSAPMFRDAPSVYCEYSVRGPNGKALPLKTFELQRNYDGNPVGMGAGRTPAPTLDTFGRVVAMDRVRSHVRRQLIAQYPKLPYVDVSQKIVGAVDDDRVGVISDQTIRVRQDAQ